MDEVGMPAEQATTLEKLRSARAAFDELLVAVGVDRMTQPMDESGWSVKDVVAHIAAYERWLTAQLRGTLRGEEPTTRELYGADAPPDGAEPFDIDRLNAVMRERDGVLSLDEVLQIAGRTFADLLDVLASLPGTAFERPGFLDWAPDDALPRVIDLQVIDHYRQHEPSIRAWIAAGEGWGMGDGG